MPPARQLPFIKVGGLGDVAGALPKALVQKGHDVRVVLPLYSSIKWEMREQCQYIKYFYFMLTAGAAATAAIFDSQ